MEIEKHTSLLPENVDRAALVAALVECFAAEEHYGAKEANALKVLEEQVFPHIHTDAQKYMGSLLKAYAHTMAIEPGRSVQDTAREIEYFLDGNYSVIGRPPSQGTYGKTPEKNYLMQLPNKPRPYISINEGAYLAFHHIMECELKKYFRDGDLARRLAANTTRLTAMDNTCRQWNPEIAQDIFVHELQRDGINVFANARIFEFAGRTGFDGLGNNPLTILFADYINHTPNKDGKSMIDSRDHVSLRSPGSFFDKAENMKESDKFDYAIASNVFCIGAVGSTDAQSDALLQGGSILAVDVLPNLANILKDGGRLLISNTATDGMDINKITKKQDISLAEIGLRTKTKRQPLHKSLGNSGLSTFERDYALRPPVAYTHMEYIIDKNQKEIGSHTRYLSREKDDQDRQLGSGWGLE